MLRKSIYLMWFVPRTIVIDTGNIRPNCRMHDHLDILLSNILNLLISPDSVLILEGR